MPSDVSRETELRIYAELLFRASQRTNLVSRRLSPDEVASLVISFSRTLSVLDIPGAGKRLLDVGSGGGLPGMPLAIANPNLEVTLNEARKLRVIELRQFVESLQLDNVEILPGRIDSDAVLHELRRLPHIVTAFGVGKAQDVIPLVAPLVSKRGVGLLSAPHHAGSADRAQILMQAAFAGLSADFRENALEGGRTILILRPSHVA